MEAERGVAQLQSKECQQLMTSHQRVGRGKEEFPYGFQREQSPADALIWGFLHQEL